ncbi:hypothetical protein [uncultured Rikenella sp.]|uniref:hypothetical protein n=1 Tax=uncultured Rikenella sp. TaxID=368003 RepID=UPI00261CC38E|nr:hypothetical protein [uncultured Rikenella sp.]
MRKNSAIPSLDLLSASEMFPPRILLPACALFPKDVELSHDCSIERLVVTFAGQGA